MQVLENTTLDEELIVTSQVTLSGEIVVNSNIIIKEGGHLIIRGATLYFDQSCEIISEGVIEAISSTFDAKRSQWGTITFKEKSSSNSLIKNCTILHGEGIVINETASNIVIDTCTISDCTSGRGGAIESYGKNIIIRNCTISDCEATDSGGGIYINNFIGNHSNNGTFVEKCKIEDCIAKNGAGIYVYNGIESKTHDYVIYKCIIQNCEAKSDGGGIYVSSDKAILDCTINNCRANREGGGIYISGNGTIKNSKINNCIAKYNGGGISCTGKNIYIESSTVYQCIADDGGGIAIHSSDKVVFNNLQIVECKANYGAGGIMVSCSTDVQSTTPTKIVKCKSFNKSNLIHSGYANGMILDHASRNLKVDNFLFIDCIEDLNSKNEYLLSASSFANMGSSSIYNFKAYHTQSDGSMQEDKIEDFISEDDSLYIDDIRFEIE